MSLLKGLPPQPPVLGTTEVDTQIAKGDKLVEEQRRELCAYSAQITYLLQVVGLVEARHRKVVSRSWFTLSIWPLDSGCNPEERLTVAPMSLQKACQNREENWGPQSETTSCGTP